MPQGQKGVMLAAVVSILDVAALLHQAHRDGLRSLQRGFHAAAARQRTRDGLAGEGADARKLRDRHKLDTHIRNRFERGTVGVGTPNRVQNEIRIWRGPQVPDRRVGRLACAGRRQAPAILLRDQPDVFFGGCPYGEFLGRLF